MQIAKPSNEFNKERKFTQKEIKTNKVQKYCVYNYLLFYKSKYPFTTVLYYVYKYMYMEIVFILTSDKVSHINDKSINFTI